MPVRALESVALRQMLEYAWFHDATDSAWAIR